MPLVPLGPLARLPTLRFGSIPSRTLRTLARTSRASRGAPLRGPSVFRPLRMPPPRVLSSPVYIPGFHPARLSASTSAPQPAPRPASGREPSTFTELMSLNANVQLSRALAIGVFFAVAYAAVGVVEGMSALARAVDALVGEDRGWVRGMLDGGV